MNETLAIELINAVNRLTIAAGFMIYASPNGKKTVGDSEASLYANYGVASELWAVMDDAEKAIYRLSKGRNDMKDSSIVWDIDCFNKEREK